MNIICVQNQIKVNVILFEDVTLKSLLNNIWLGDYFNKLKFDL